jgi:hypothetical protein
LALTTFGFGLVGGAIRFGRPLVCSIAIAWWERYSRELPWRRYGSTAPFAGAKPAGALGLLTSGRNRFVLTVAVLFRTVTRCAAPAYLQQLEMDAMASALDRDGNVSPRHRAGAMGQRTDNTPIFKCCNQGTAVAPAEFVVVKSPPTICQANMHCY